MKLLDQTHDQFHDLLTSFHACNEAVNWAKGKTAKEVIETCYRGDWLLWLYKRLRPEDLQGLTLAKGHCANTVRHLMKDKRSTKAVDAAIAFGEGKITREELRAAYAAAAAADADAAAAAADAAADAAAADAAADAYAAAAAADDAAADAYADALQKNRLLTANICRQYLKFAEVEILTEKI